jgi:protein-tyrosine phosphatase
VVATTSLRRQLRNLRDVGGLRTADGRQVRGARLYRCATPAFLDEAGATELVSTLQIRSRVDLRGRREKALETSPHLLAVEREVRHLPIGAGGAWLADATGIDDVSEVVSRHYLRYLEHSANSIRGLVETLLDERAMPTLVHCTAGKDRTGVTVALILSAIGVLDDDVVEDYALSKEELGAIFAQLGELPAFAERVANMPAESRTSEPATMVRFLEEVRRTYGGARDYLTHIGVSEDELHRLEESLLEPAPD